MATELTTAELERVGQERWLQGSPWYQRSYFEERVGEELYRSQRYKADTSLILVRLPAVSRRAAHALYTYVSTQLRTLDMAGMMGTGDYVVCLPHTPREGAEVVAGRMRAFLDEYSPQIGVASYCKETADFESLLAAAEARINAESSGTKKRAA